MKMYCFFLFCNWSIKNTRKNETKTNIKPVFFYFATLLKKFAKKVMG